MTEPNEAEICTRAEALLDQAFNSEDDTLREALERAAHQLLAPLVAAGFPEALYLHACCTLHLEGLDDQTHGERYVALVRQAAHGRDARAQFRMGQMHEPESELEADAAESARWFELSALQGYPYAQWVHGLNLWTGHGRPRDQALGLEFICKAAEGRFEGAIQFVADAHASGTHGYPKDEAQTMAPKARRARCHTLLTQAAVLGSFLRYQRKIHHFSSGFAANPS